METETKSSVNLRWSVRRDVPEMVYVDRNSFASHWSEQDFLENLKHRNVIAMVAAHQDRVVGSFVYALHGDWIELMRMSVDHEFRRRGIGASMINKLKSKLNGNRRRTLKILVRESNLDALAFLKANGFLAIAVQREGFADSGEDGYVMRFEMKEVLSAAPPGHMPKNRVAKFMI